MMSIYGKLAITIALLCVGTMLATLAFDRHMRFSILEDVRQWAAIIALATLVMFVLGAVWTI